MTGFSFGFSGDDIDVDADDTQVNDIKGTGAQETNTPTLPEPVKAQRHEMDEWLSTLPSQMSYNKCTINPPATSETSTQPGLKAEPEEVTVVRRDVFDIRTQLMAEDSAEEQNDELIAGLEKGDITPNFYEGGFKTWECSIDLAGFVAGEGDFGGEDGHVIELGSGTAVPSLALFARLLAQTETTPLAGSEKGKRTHFTFADYNSSVLRLVTLPNLLLTWDHMVTHLGVEDSKHADEQEEDMLEITSELIDRFRKDLDHRGITVSFISGAWSPLFVDLVFSPAELASYRTLVLASETIYSPASLGAFSETLLGLLRSSAGDGSRALIAAKKVYFGVGGGVDEFLAVLRDISEGEAVVEERMDVKSAGVGRIIMEVKPNQ